MNCKDKELNAKLYSNRAAAHLNLGEKFLLFYMDDLRPNPTVAQKGHTYDHRGFK